MSALDKAFAKAYRQSVTSPVAARPTAISAGPPVDAKKHAPPASAPAALADLYGAQVTFADIGHVNVRRPHASFATAQQLAINLPPLAEDQATREPLLAPVELVIESAAPHSTGRATETVAIRTRQQLRAMFEVPQFSWPTMVKDLSAAVSPQLTSLLRSMTAASKQGQKLVLVTGSARGEGRTTVAMALGKALASATRKVLLADADFEHGQLADAMGILPQVGWDDVLWGDQPLAEALVESMDDHLSLLPLRQLSSGINRRTPVAQWKASLAELTQNYDLVLFDAGPLTDQRLPCDTAALASQHPIDAALVVRDLRRGGMDSTREVGRRLMACDIARWNIIENFSAAAA